MHRLLLTLLIAITSVGSIPSAIRQYRMFTEAFERQSDGDFVVARRSYALLLTRYPNGIFRQEALFNLAGTEYSLNRFEQASSLYAGLQASRGAVGWRASYNRGNALATIAFSNRKAHDFPDQLRASLACYRKALVTNPMDTDARINYEIVLRALNSISPPRTAAASGGGGSQGKTGPGSPQQKLSNDVSQLVLNNASQDEGQMIRRYFKPAPPRQARKEEKDW